MATPRWLSRQDKTYQTPFAFGDPDYKPTRTTRKMPNANAVSVHSMTNRDKPLTTPTDSDYKTVNQQDRFTVPTSSEFWTRDAVRKKIGRITQRIANALPPKSKVKDQSEKPIKRGKRLSYEGFAASLGGLHSN